MKPMPNIEDDAAMILRGKRSSLAAARNDAEACLRDAYTVMQGAEWADLPARLADVQACVDRLRVVGTAWEAIK